MPSKLHIIQRNWRGLDTRELTISIRFKTDGEIKGNNNTNPKWKKGLH